MLVFGGISSSSAEDLVTALFPDFEALVHQGHNEILITGFTWHDSSTYDSGKDLNDLAWGGGYARYFDHYDGDPASTVAPVKSDILFGMVFADSNRRPEVALGYGRTWTFASVENLSWSFGYAAGITMRHDIWDGAPIPYILPLLNLRLFKRLDLFASYIPPLPSNSFGDAPGNVPFLFMGWRF
ncbi:hypothetical protein [Ancylobacter oerskovii]|uniref:Antimicrobial peptide resistance and lipid A acylation PagP n=1 Tax=Ancylobacter oerskovii TaxID=459519 RepID=A0ABW4YS16_9HYPH|nr:hypothetical protein [Ancylobacter oerskovii]MBS7545270.1 hypothetical protein [Ancylobacter oerskovii]